MENNKNFRIRWHFSHSLTLHSTALHFISRTPDGLCLGSWHYDESNQSGERSCGMKANVLSSWETLTSVSHFLCSGLEERLWRAVWVDPSKWTPQVRFCARPHTQKKSWYFTFENCGWRTRQPAWLNSWGGIKKKKQPSKPTKEQHADLTRERGNKKEN